MNKEKPIYTQDGTFEFSFEITPSNRTGTFQCGFKKTDGNKSFYFKGDKGIFLDSDGQAFYTYREGQTLTVTGNVGENRVAYHVNGILVSTSLAKGPENIDKVFLETDEIEVGFSPEVLGKEANIEVEKDIFLDDNLQGKLVVKNEGNFDVIVSDVSFDTDSYRVLDNVQKEIDPSNEVTFDIERIFEDAPGDEFQTNWNESIPVNLTGNFGRKTVNLEIGQNFAPEASFSIEGGNTLTGAVTRTLRVNFDVSRGIVESQKRLPVEISFEGTVGRSTTDAWDVLIQRPGKFQFFSMKDNENVVGGDYLNEKSLFFVNGSGFFRVRIQRFASGSPDAEEGLLKVKIGEVEEEFQVSGSG